MILDEAHIFAPQKSQAETTVAVIDLATRGRKRGLSLLATAQRLSKLHKDVAAELLNKVIRRTGVDIDVSRAADELGMNRRDATQSLRNLQPGEFFCFGPALTQSVTKIRIGSVVSRRPCVGDRFVESPPDPSEKIKKLLPQLADLPKASEKELKTIGELKSELTKLRTKQTIMERELKEQGVPESDVKKRIAAALREQKQSQMPVEANQQLPSTVKKVNKLTASARVGRQSC